MRQMAAILTMVLILAWAVPATSKIITYPITDDIYFGSDTLHVTTTDTKWALGTGAVYWFRLINPTSATLTIRVQQGDSVSTIGSFCGAYGTWLWPMESSLLAPIPADSIWIDGSASATIYVDWLEVK
jgi:hypothetical protein